jgi:predicted nucleic acid-binding protein
LEKWYEDGRGQLLKLRCYLDTSVIGAVFDKEDPPRIEVTKDLFKMLNVGSVEGYVSDITIAEIIKAPQELKGDLQRILGEPWRLCMIWI